MKLVETSIPDVVIIEPQVFGDDRGFFMETFRQSLMDDLGGPYHFVQDNHSRSQQGVLRGLHYQISQPQGKLVRAIRGEIYDVAVDLRKSSATFGQYVGVFLNADNKRSLWVPPGFAHGFYCVSDDVEIVYKCTDYYAPEHERSLIWNDETVGIDWPLVDNRAPLLSAKDAASKKMADADFFN